MSIRLKLFSFSSNKASGALIDLQLGERDSRPARVVGFRVATQSERRRRPRLLNLGFLNFLRDDDDGDQS